MRIDLESMDISAFKSFGMNAKVSFPSNQVTAIIGKNEDDGGSNGTGKSSLSVTPMVNLFGSKIGAGMSVKNLENRYLNETTRLVGSYRIDGKPLVVDRILGGKMSFTFDGVPNKDGSADAIQAQLNEILKITDEQISVLSNKAQEGEFGGFLLMTDSKKKDFLSSFFDVSFIEKAKDDADVELSTKTKSLSTLSGKIQYITDSIATAEKRATEALQKFDMLNSDAFRATVAAMKEQRDSLMSNKAALESIAQMSEPEFFTYANSLENVQKVCADAAIRLVELNGKLSQATIELSEKSTVAYDLELKISSEPEVPQELSQQLAQIDAVIQEQNRRNKKARELHSSLISTKMMLKTSEEELAKVNNSSCSSCGAPLSPEKIQERRTKVEAGIPIFQKQINDLESQIKELEVSDADIAQAQAFREGIVTNVATFKANNSVESVRKEFNAVKMVILSLNSSISNLKMAIQNEEKAVPQAVKAVRDGLDSAITKLRLDISTVEAAIKSKEFEVQVAQREYERTVAEVTKAKAELASFSEEKAKLEEDIDTLSRVTQITSKTGFIGYIFDSLLEDLNSEINENLKLIPNTRKFSLQFIPDKIAKTTGTVSKAITYEILSGTERVEWDTLSGGEKLSVILAVDESLDTVLSRRLGVTVGWKFLDEQFYWIDENSKEAILSFFRVKSSDRAYFIVDHTSEFNAAFDNKITIVKRNNIASVA